MTVILFDKHGLQNQSAGIGTNLVSAKT